LVLALKFGLARLEGPGSFSGSIDSALISFREDLDLRLGSGMGGGSGADLRDVRFDIVACGCEIIDTLDGDLSRSRQYSGSKSSRWVVNGV
jgi:hypothetical protein